MFKSLQILQVRVHLKCQRVQFPNEIHQIRVLVCSFGFNYRKQKYVNVFHVVVIKV